MIKVNEKLNGDELADAATDFKNEEIFTELSKYLYDYLSNINDLDSMPMSIDELYDSIDEMSPYDAFNLALSSKESFSRCDEIFWFDGYGNIQSCCCWETYFENCIDLSDFANWYNDNILNEEEYL